MYLSGIHIRVVSERVWRNVQDSAKKQGLATESRGWLAVASRQMMNTCQACQKLKRHASWSTTGQNLQTGRSVTSQLELETQSSRKSKPPASSVLKNLTLCIPFSLQYKYPLYPQNVGSFQREYWERNHKEKTRLTHPQSSHRDSSNSSTLILSIVTSLRGSLPKPFLTIPTSVRRSFGAWEVVRKGPISYWLML